MRERPIGRYFTARDDGAYERTGVYWISGSKRWLIHDDDVLAEIHRLESGVSQLAIPFDPFSNANRRQSARQTVEDSKTVSGRWPSMEHLEGMERYKPFQLTQSIFKYTGNPNGIIRGVHRSATEAKYQVPGGLIGVKGWRSELYRTNIMADETLAFIGVKNSMGSYQNEAAFLRSYPDGAEFDDLLINTKTNKVFEHRVAQKVDGKWERFIAYSDPDERPAGYVQPSRKECASCHKDAASGGYGVGLAPGSDEIFSDPFTTFPALGEERQIRLR